MYKSFTLFAAIAAMPLSQNMITSGVQKDNTSNSTSFVFNFKNTSTVNPFASAEKSAALWSQNWMDDAQENIRKSEYNFKWEEKLKAYCTPNRKNNLRFFYNTLGFSVEPRTTKIPIEKFDPKAKPDEIKYRYLPNWKIDFNLDKTQLREGNWKVTDNQAQYVTDKITVQYVNNDEGMRQNFMIHSPLSEGDELKINFSIKTGLKIYLHGNQLQFFYKKRHVLNYAQLKVWDAAGKLLQASINKQKRKFYIKVNTKDAIYPITIDPLSSSPVSTPDDANQAGAQFGCSVSSAGDVNGDGYSDVIIGANQFDDGANIDEGRAFLYYGSNAGILASPASIPDDADQANAFFGNSVATAGDVNGDGYSDVIIGAPYYDDGANTNEGRAFVYHGSVSGLSATPNSTADDADQANALFGYSVAVAGDVNGDGYSDVIIGAPNYTDGANIFEGRAYVYYGAATGLPALPSNTPDDANQAAAIFGISVAGAGDVNGDGFSDVIIGAIQFDDGANTDEGRAYVYHGSAAGLSASPNSTPDDANQGGAFFGNSVASAGDVNGDGYSDIIIGAPYYDDLANNNEGRAFVYHGSATGILVAPSSLLDDTNQASAYAGFAVACAGDINGDGYSDVMMGAYLFDDLVYTDAGRILVYQGSATGLPSLPSSTYTDGNQNGAQFGYSVSSAGDVNGDGYSDVIIGANLFDDGANTDEGRAMVYQGSAKGLADSPNTIPDDADQINAQFGYSVSNAGDVNGDGYSDVIIGAFTYDDGANTDEGRAFVYHGSASGLSAAPNSTPDDADQANARFGISVSTAGDVNGDGYSDVIIGAYLYDDAANIDEGRAFVYHGSATGLSATPNSIPDDADQANARFGISVNTAGDVNGDGYSDIIVGALAFDDGANIDEGRAFVYHGSATGISTIPNSVPDDANQTSANFGASVSGAGDVNGDGFSDVIIGAYFFDDGANTNEGRAFVYHGSATGLMATPNSIPDDANQAFARFGASVACAGDVNGDGYSDVIIGVPYYDGIGYNDEGAAFLYHGSSTGLSASPNSIRDDANQTSAYFGNSVSGAGDINGDGYADVIIGAYGYDDVGGDEGRAFVYTGSTTGILTSPNSTPDDANVANVLFAISVSGAGDVNGDGYSDVIIGAPTFDDGANTDEGRAFVYNGNELTSNKRNNLRLYNTNLTTPINSSNFPFGNFGTGLYAKHFLGRAKGKLVWETRVNYNAYSGTPITSSTLFTSQQASFTDMGLTGIEFKNLVSKILGGRYTKIRARIKYDQVTAITGQLYSPWRNVSNIIDANNMGILPVELIAFNAAWLQKGKTARLDFKTDKESGVCCFEIEKSNDGISFYPVAVMPAKNVSGIQSYSFIDANATGKNQFYRIKIKGITGQMDYSNIQQLQNDKAIEILFFPNPTTDVLQLQLSEMYYKTNVLIINSAGQLVKRLQLPAFNQTITIPIQNLAAGIYWLHLESGGNKQVLQFVKL